MIASSHSIVASIAMLSACAMGGTESLPPNTEDAVPTECPTTEVVRSFTKVLAHDELCMFEQAIWYRDPDSAGALVGRPATCKTLCGDPTITRCDTPYVVGYETTGDGGSPCPYADLLGATAAVMLRA
jgi:hypothetical protein